MRKIFQGLRWKLQFFYYVFSLINHSHSWQKVSKLTYHSSTIFRMLFLEKISISSKEVIKISQQLWQNNSVSFKSSQFFFFQANTLGRYYRSAESLIKKFKHFSFTFALCFRLKLWTSKLQIGFKEVVWCYTYSI